MNTHELDTRTNFRTYSTYIVPATYYIQVLLSISVHTYMVHTGTYMNNHIYSTLFKTQERESDRRSKEIEQRMESQKNTQTKQEGHVTLSTELQSTALTLQFLAASTA